MTGEIEHGVWAIADRVQRTLQECGGGAGIKYLSRMEKQEGPTPCARKRVHKFNVGLCVARMDRHGSESYEHQSGVCTKSARQRFRTQDLRFVER